MKPSVHFNAAYQCRRATTIKYSHCHLLHTYRAEGRDQSASLQHIELRLAEAEHALGDLKAQEERAKKSLSAATQTLKHVRADMEERQRSLDTSEAELARAKEQKEALEAKAGHVSTAIHEAQLSSAEGASSLCRHSAMYDVMCRG